jgi:hypothetical protein
MVLAIIESQKTMAFRQLRVKEMPFSSVCPIVFEGLSLDQLQLKPQIALP